MPRPHAVLLDVNGTLTDPALIGAPWGRAELGEAVLQRAVSTAMVDALLGHGDRPFSDHIRASIRVLVDNGRLDPAGVDAAIRAAASLPPRPDAAAALEALHAAGIRAVALTNSGAQAGESTLRAAGLIDHVERVLGVDVVGTFKPDPRVYAHALSELGSPPPQAVVLLATHPWDLAGGAHAGMRTAWVTHGARAWPDVFPLPTVTGATLTEVARQLTA
jgi:2-haloacid dehalogenase